MYSFRLCLAACLLGFGVAAAEPVATPTKVVIQLKDQSQVVGEMVGLRDGVYQVRTESLGILRIPQSNIAGIVFDRSALAGERPVAGSGPAAAGQPTGAAAGADASPDLAPLFKSITSNPDLMGKIEGLKEDADIQAVVNDPEIMKAVASGNFKALLENEKVKALMDNPQIQSLTKEVAATPPAVPAPPPQKRAAPKAPVQVAP